MSKNKFTRVQIAAARAQVSLAAFSGKEVSELVKEAAATDLRDASDWKKRD